ncbi:SAM-dependent methyltransferase [Pedobacter africanus]|uniref:SAM-dependent methyltransferase n=1 Tax=Pedobacter africanus TaxID=151894 RepID=A0ACC6L3C1_9SPHI|nr:class I SAM-dependent methyltransferase [Pedobacter africanus]MDR6785778.1 SAM-dependent methyltransferase [Pedobacter africanus]
MIEEKYALGKAIYGDDFNIDQIKAWYDEESEAYADLGSKEKDTYDYSYHKINRLHGFKYLPEKQFERGLAFGAAWGHEILPIADRITELHIIEPSDHMRSEQIGNLKPVYSKPTVEGAIHYPDGHFDLVTCLGVIHHIPNVSFVISELCRVTKAGGYILLREPVISMGDWTVPRKGLTRNERGIPLPIFRKILAEQNVEVVNEALCFCMSSFFQRFWSRFSSRPVYTLDTYLWFDKWMSRLTEGNLHYHATSKLQRIAGQSVYYVLKKK